MKNILDIKKAIGNRKLKIEELQLLLKTLQDFKEKKKHTYLERNKQHQRLRKFSEKYHLSPIKPSYDYQNELNAFQKNKEVKYKTIKVKKLDYPHFRDRRTNQVNPSKFYTNNQSVMQVYPKLSQNLKEDGIFNEHRITSTKNKRNRFHQALEKSTSKQMLGNF